jgi:hypothetical protein
MPQAVAKPHHFLSFSVQLRCVPEFTAYGARKFCFVVNSADFGLVLQISEYASLTGNHPAIHFGNRSDYA